MKTLALCCACALLLLTGCNGWPVPPVTYAPPTLFPTRTPSIETATPLILTPAPLTATVEASTSTPETASPTPAEATSTGTVTPTLTPTPGTLGVSILGCDTGIDIVHQMGEVTNAYVKITNTTSAEVPDLCATLSALDEGRPHPDKTKCLPSLAPGYQVTFKLTVDTTYRQDTPVQVNVTSNGNLLARVGEPACTAIGLLLPTVSELDEPIPIP